MANFSYNQNYGEIVTSPFTASPYVRLDLSATLDKFRTARTRYTVSTVDTQSPFVSGQFSVLWDIPFADLNYSFWCTLREVSPVKGTGKASYSVGLCSPSVNGLTGYLNINGSNPQGGDVVGIDVLAIHD